MADLAPGLLEILVCPLSRAPVVLVDGWLYSTDPTTRRRYPVRDGIPVMLIDEAETVGQAEFERVMQQAGMTPPVEGTNKERT